MIRGAWISSPQLPSQTFDTAHRRDNQLTTIQWLASLQVRVAAVALMGWFVVAPFSHAADKSDKKKAQGVSGTVKSVDTTSKTITITVKVEKESEDKTLSVPDNAKLTVDGEKKTLTDVEVGVSAQCKLSEDGKSVTAISIGKKPKKDK